MQDEEMLVPDGSGTAELEIKKSKFISQCFHVSDDRESKKIIADLRSVHKTADHIVYAFICGPEKSRNMGMSDDGEPKGTAGKPVLQVLKGSGITNILCTVVRYFGGVKLGTGGLVKAYTESAREAVNNSAVKKQIKKCAYLIYAGYEYYDQIKRVIAGCEGGGIASEIFTDNIELKIIIPDSKKLLILKVLSDISSGRIIIKETEL